MRLWRKPGKDFDAAKSVRGISHRALDGASRDELCEEALRFIRQSALTLNRFGIWLAPEGFLSSSGSLASFSGYLWDSEQEPQGEWCSLEAFLPLPAELVKQHSALESRASAGESALSARPASEMGWSLWVPVVVERQLQGVMFAASRKTQGVVARDLVERLAAELALALSAAAKDTLLRAAQRDLALAKETLNEGCANLALESALRRIVNSGLHGVVERQPIGPFVMIGLLPARSLPQAAVNGPMEFRWVAGDNWLARAAMADPMAAVWREALQQSKTIGREPSGRWPHQNVSRVIAVPLFASGQTAGVLVAALSHSSATFANVERLEFHARLASTVLTLAAQNESSATVLESALESARFFVQHAAGQQFVLNTSLEIIAASDSGRQLLSAPPHSRPPQALSSLSRSPLEGSVTYDEPDLGGTALLFPASEWPRLSAWISDVSRAKGAARSLETRLRTGKRAQLWTAALPGGNVSLIVHQIREEIVEERQPSQELQSLIEWLDQGVLLLDRNESVCAVNLRFSQLFSLSAGELADARNLRDLIALVAPRVTDPTHFAERWWEASRGAEADLHEEVQILQPAPRLLERSSHPILSASGTRTGRLELYRDLSAQQLFQAKLRKSERLAALGERVSGVAHELSNPLTTILGYAQRLLAKPSAPARRSDIRRICSEAERASTILRQLLGSARETAPEQHPVSLNSVIQRAAELQRSHLVSEKIRLELDLAPGLPPVLGDSGQLQQVLMNLIANSRHAFLEHRGSGAITFRTRLSGSGRVVLEVSDTGPGIPEALRHRIFDPFFTTKPPGQGTGLGLSIVAGLVRQHGGHIRLQSSAQGATFVIDFPPASPAVEVPHPLPALPPAIVSPDPIARGERVLVVEDEPTVAQLIADMLADLGYSSDTRQDARRALVSALNRQYSFVICDMKMPGFDGQHFYRALVEAGSPLAAKFLFVTGDVLGVATQEFLQQNRLPHIAKPFRVEEFTEKIAHLFAKPALASSQDPSHSNLVRHG